MFREMTRNFFEKEVKPFHGEWEKAGEVPRELWTKAGDLGLLATMTPEAYGGMVRPATSLASARSLLFPLCLFSFALALAL